MKRLISIPLICLFIIGSMAFSSIAGAHCASDDWPMFHHDLALSGYTTSHGPETNNILWTYKTGGSVESSPAVVGNKVYIGSWDGKLYCLDKYTGELIWSYQTNSPIQSSPAVSSAVSGQQCRCKKKRAKVLKVYFLSTDGTVYALNANDGALIWSTSIGPGPWDWSSPAVHDGNVFIASSIGKLYSLDGNTGSVNWGTPVGGTPNSPISVVNGKVYSGTHNMET